ncbi:MAG: helix-turn-helix transcriptional regulator [Candidatus Hadarchaeum sp.]|uniref:helix-turn-helix transcriptional regulator n=1 Tax=Candidatus Hadarchaeum sp. TaxID=2883567 RepID=UPI003D12F997
MVLRSSDFQRQGHGFLNVFGEYEHRILEAILRSDGVAYQDKLRRELDMSKSKLSALVKNLEHKHAITKERYFRTNILKVNREFLGK